MTDASLVLVLSKNERNQSLLTDLVNEEGCETRPVSTVEEFDNVLRGEDSITIAVLDTEGYTADLWKRCGYLNERDIPTVVLTPETPP
ncbi:response regulator, partial [Haladaptatus sp.]|uniref:response regulator n=1 Tax=Haladaptatus sp. TaxID=1973141 RepID=UPI003C35E043